METDVICLPDLSEADRPAHSVLGASGAERWSHCPGSVTLLRELKLPETDDPDYRKEGTAMHAAAEHCLREGLDTWEIVGQVYEDVAIDEPMADAIQVYVDLCRKDILAAQVSYIEFAVSSPIHKDFYGTLDFAAIYGISNLTRKPFPDPGPKPEGFVQPTQIVVRDLKGGEGIIVEPDDNPQLQYYAFGLIDKHPEWDDDIPVSIEIVQPRAFHHDGPHRTWPTTVGAIREWVKSFLVPAMARVEIDGTLDAGKWCRFCPAKLVCPQVTGLFKAAATANPKELVGYSLEATALSYQQLQAVKFYIKALEEDVYHRLNKGETMDGVAKLVAKKANRVWNAGAPTLAKERFGDKVFHTPVMLSPAELEKLGPKEKAFVKEFAHQPFTGTTVAAWDDTRVGMVKRTAKETFSGVLDHLEKGVDGGGEAS